MVVRLPGGENGVEEEIIDALLGVTRLLRHDRYPVLVVAEHVRPTPATGGAATVWRSLTPFLGPLHYRRNRISTLPLNQLLSTLKGVVGMMTPDRVEHWVVPVLGHLYVGSKNGNARNYRFVRRAGTSFTIEFAEPIQLPLAVGSDAHFRLGQFEPVSPASEDGGAFAASGTADVTADCLTSPATSE